LVFVEPPSAIMIIFDFYLILLIDNSFVLE